MDRRSALLTLGSATTALAWPSRSAAREVEGPSSESVGLLYDSTRCIGCRACMNACREENGLEATQGSLYYDPFHLSANAPTVICCQEDGSERAFVKVQCMHCVDPACASACMLGAFHKDEDGAVIWDGELCVGCRYCQVACPFGVPHFEWDATFPKLVKCDLCSDRRAVGMEPACVEACPREAVIFGRRSDLLDEAWQRIECTPTRYEHHVYGETEGGGTHALYVTAAGVSFDELGLPPLGDESVPSLPEKIQHTIYRGFAAPVALYGVLGALVWRHTKEEARESEAHPDGQGVGAAREGGPEVSHGATSRALGGKLRTRAMTALLAVVALGLVLLGWRFGAGLGAVTALSDGYPWGLWIAFDVVTGTALGCGGYALAILIYVLNRGRYHPLIRSAIVTSALGYSLGGIGVMIDLGRFWNVYKVPLFFWNWNLNSILLEVALCIMLYTVVLWIELSPAFLERWSGSGRPRLRAFAAAATPFMERALPWVIALGLLLPTMHQSSLGSLMLLAGEKLHPLWQTPLLPLLFLISCIAMGYGVVAVESTLSSHIFGLPRETRTLGRLAPTIAFVLLLWVALRVLDLAFRGSLPLVFSSGEMSLLFALEMTLFVIPAVWLLSPRARWKIATLFRAAMLVVLGGALYRFSTYLIAYDPGPGWSYFPAVPELLITVGLVAAEVAVYVVLVKTFPILRGAVPAQSRA